MRLQDKDIVAAFNSVVVAGHPDPVGFIARAELLTKLDPAKNTKFSSGPFAANIKLASASGYSRSSLKDTEQNLSAAFDVDKEAYNTAKEDLKEMYRIVYARSKRMFDKFWERLVTRKDELEELMVFDSDGILVELKEDTTEDGVALELASIVDPDAPVRVGLDQMPTPDAFVDKPRAYLSLAELDNRLSALVYAIVREQAL